MPLTPIIKKGLLTLYNLKVKILFVLFIGFTNNCLNVAELMDCCARLMHPSLSPEFAQFCPLELVIAIQPALILCHLYSQKKFALLTVRKNIFQWLKFHGLHPTPNSSFSSAYM